MGRGTEMQAQVAPCESVAGPFLVRTVEHVTISYMLDPPPVGRAEIVDELTALIAGYLRNRL